MFEIPTAPVPVRVTYHGRYHISTVVNYRNEYETRVFKNDPTSRVESEVPPEIRDLIERADWHSMVDDVAFKGYDSEHVTTFNNSDAQTVHSVLIGFLTLYNTGTLA